MKTTKIEWTDKTWNPVTGCTKISSGCAHCYAEVMARRLQAMGQAKYADGFRLTLHESKLLDPLVWKRPHTIFVCSMSDLFHQDVPDSFLDRVMGTIMLTPWHRYQLLTKRAARMANYFSSREIPKNAWLGVTVEDRARRERIDALRSLPATVRFLSCEPLLEDLDTVDLTGIHWVIAGGESGPKARPMHKEWVESLKDQAEATGAAFFFKQWGAWGSDGVKRGEKANGKRLDGRVWQNMPMEPTRAFEQR
jgi:protein gp37